MRDLIQTTFDTNTINSAITKLKQNLEVVNWAKEETLSYNPKNISHAFYIILNGPPPKCEFGNDLQFNTFNKGYRKGCVLGNKCKCVSKHRRANQKITLIEKYGVEESGKIPSAIAKRKATMVERYGVEYAGQSVEITQKRLETVSHRTEEQRVASAIKTKETNRLKYGADHHMQLQSQQDKVKQTNLTKYGVEVPLQSDQIKEKFKETLTRKSATKVPQQHIPRVIDEDHPVWLYIKQHRVTGLKYFGQTAKADPTKYLGSGKRWKAHLKKHGAFVDTLWCKKFICKAELVEVATTFSIENNIVESADWANLKVENGLDGFPPGYVVTETHRANQSIAAKNRKKNNKSVLNKR